MKKWGIVIMLIIWVIVAQCQVFLQIEKFNSPHSIKMMEGDYIQIKTYAYPDDWRAMRIEQIMVDDNVIIFSDDMLSITEISEARIRKNTVKQVALLLETFGITWFTFAGILQVVGRWDFGVDTAVIGGTALIGGYVLDKTKGHSVYKMGKNARLRIVDLRM